jgi:NitT/TauT family transport system permease protein
MTSAEITSGLSEPRAIPRQWIVIGGRILLAVALLLAWEWAARSLGPLFFAPPLATAQRIAEMAASGKLFTDVVATMRVSVIGFVIGCICGVGVPFLLRPLPRVTAAVEPFIMASQGIPKYALTPWLILWFGIGDTPKVIVVTLFTFYITFITVFAGIRGVDQRLINMARIIGASERTIARKVIWLSLLPFFFTGLKVALPRAVSAAIVGEFLVSTEGVGFSIERARQLSDTTGVFAGITVAVTLVLIINAIVNALERRALKWRPTDRDMQV